MRLFFLGGLFPKSAETDEILWAEKGIMQNAANLLQWSLVNGFDKNLKTVITVINAVFVGSFPINYRKLFVHSFRFSHSKGAQDINCGFLNLFVVKHFSRYFCTKQELKRHIGANKSRDALVVVYSMHTPFIYAAAYAKKKFGAQVVLICPDLPEYMDTSTKKRILYRIFKWVDRKTLYRAVHNVDYFVVLTEQMNQAVNKYGKPYCVVEGIANSSISDINIMPEEQREDREKIIMYSGTMHERYGIKILLDAFLLCESANLRLVLCGKGDFSDKIPEYERTDSRIHYCGTLPQQEIFLKQKKADILINPRQNTEIFTKYSFPSKIMEYMAAGKPVICYHLDGIPKEYGNYLIYVNGNAKEQLAKEIERVANLPDNQLKEIGERNKRFVLSEKNEMIQTKKILDMIKST